MYPQILSHCVNWARSHGSYGVEFEEEGDKVRVFLRTWDADTFRRVCVATVDRYSNDRHQEISVLLRVVDAWGPDVNQWWLNRPRRSLLRISGQWVPSKTD